MTTTPPDDSTPADASGAPPERERPRFGEYAPVPSSGTPAPAAPVPPVASAPPVAPPAAPQYGSNPPPQYGSNPPQYGSNPPPQYTGYQSPLGSTPPGHGYPGPLVGSAPRPKTVGIVAFVVGLVVLIGSPIFSALVAQGLSPLMSYYSNGTIDTSDIPADELNASTGAVLGVFATLAFAAIFGLWALIQGIVAAVTRRGRVFGVLAIVCSVVAPIVSVIVFYVVLIAAAPEFFQR